MLDDITIKSSIRRNAKNISLRINHKGEVVVTSPYALSKRKFDTLIKENNAWIEQGLEHYQKHRSFSLPENLVFAAADRTWEIQYQKTAAKAKLMMLNQDTLVIYGDYDKTKVQQLLKKWLNCQAKLYLFPWLKEVSDKINLNYSSISVGQHRSQWGSCSRDKRLCLNAKLLFLPAFLVEHVMIHELAHTVHFDHSKEFWQLVAKHDIHWRANKAALKQADDYLPGWLK